MLLPCLLNRQNKIKFCVPADYTSDTNRLGESSRSINISVVGLQSDKISLKGPEFPRPAPQLPLQPQHRPLVTPAMEAAAAAANISTVPSLASSPVKSHMHVAGDSPGLPEASRSSVVAGGSISVASVPSGTSVSNARRSTQETQFQLMHRRGTNSAPAATLRSSDCGSSVAAMGMSISLRFQGDPLHIETNSPAGASSFGFLTSPSNQSRSPASRTPGSSLERNFAQPVTPRMGQSPAGISSAPTLASVPPTPTTAGEALTDQSSMLHMPLPPMPSANGGEHEHTFPNSAHDILERQQQLREEVLHEQEVQERKHSARSSQGLRVQAEFSGSGSGSGTHASYSEHTATTPLETWLEARPVPQEWLSDTNEGKFISPVPSGDVSPGLKSDELMSGHTFAANNGSREPSTTLASVTPRVLLEASGHDVSQEPSETILSPCTAANTTPIEAAGRSPSAHLQSSFTAPLENVCSTSAAVQHKLQEEKRNHGATSALEELPSHSSNGAVASSFSPFLVEEPRGAGFAIPSTKDTGFSVGSMQPAVHVNGHRSVDRDTSISFRPVSGLPQARSAGGSMHGSVYANMSQSGVTDQSLPVRFENSAA